MEVDKTKYGRRLLVNIVDERAKLEPSQPWIYVPKSSHPKLGWKAITFKEAANAVNKIAHRILDVSGTPSHGNFPTVAYIGPNDARYPIFMLAAVKAGYQVGNS
jgi:acyl-CoA synthetase (AMP-forming)/AMP-acid ligase II